MKLSKIILGIAMLLITLYSATAEIYFNDSFNRADSNTVGNSWVETESDASSISINSNRLRLNSAYAISPQARRDFDSTIINDTDLKVNWRVQASVTNSYAQMFIYDSSNNIITRVDLINTGQIAIYTGGSYTNLQAYSTNTWYNITLYDIDFTTDTLKVNIDGTDYTNGGLGYAFENPTDNFDAVYLANNKNVANLAYFDYIIFYTQEITQPNPQITASNFWNTTSINSFWVYLNNSNYTTTNGTIILNSEFTNETIQIGSNNYFTRNITQQNFSNSTITDYELKQTDITFNFLFSNGDNVLTPINFTRLDTGQSTVIYNGTTRIFPNAGEQSFHIECNNEIFAPFNITLNFTALENNTYNYTVNETQTVLTFYDSETTLPIQDANITINYPTTGSEILQTNSTGKISFSYINSDVVDFGEYIFTFNKLGYLRLNFTENINSSTIPFSKSYNISRANITIRAFNRSTGELLSGINVTVNFVNLFNETTTTGTLTKSNLSIMQDTYTIYVSADRYRTETRVFDFSNQENINIDFYLLSLDDENAGVLTASTIDSYYRELRNAKVELLEYRAEDLSFVSVSQCLSNNEGFCDFLIELNKKVYYLRGTYIDEDGNTLVAQTNTGGEIFTTSGQTRSLIFLYTSDFIIDGVANLIYSISETFVNNVSQITFNFLNNDGTNVQGCIEYFKLENSGYVSVTNDTYCLNATSAVQNIGTSVTLNRSNSYRADVYINGNYGNFVLKSYYYESITSTGEVFGEDIIGAIIIFLWVVSLAFGLHTNNISIFFIASIILSWLEVLIFTSFSMVVISIFITIISYLTIVNLRKVRETS